MGKMLLVGQNHPRKCGIASHVIQLEAALKKEGWIVDILSPFDCDGTYHENLRGGFKFLKILKYARNYDRINVHFTFEEYFYYRRNFMRVLNIFPMVALLILFWKVKNLNFVIHEPPPTPHWFQRTWLDRLVWSHVPMITFFTEKERKLFERKYKLTFRDNQCKVEEVSQSFQVFSNLSKNESRKMLGIEDEKTVLLCIGFISRNKGFDRIAKIFSENNFDRCHLFIVGSLRQDNDKSSQEYYSQLYNICSKVNNITLIKQFVSYSDFDIWINAADYLVIPYREISNSGVLGRTKVLNRPAIVANVGGLADQAKKIDILFSNDLELKDIILSINEKHIELQSM